MTDRYSLIVPIACLLACVGLAPVTADDGFEETAKALLREHCMSCHDPESDDYPNLHWDESLTSLSQVDHLIQQIETRSMPPEDAGDPPSSRDRELMILFLRYGNEKQLDARPKYKGTISLEENAERVRRDLVRLQGDYRKQDYNDVRYLTLFNLNNQTDTTDQDMYLYQLALVKMLNSLSHNSRVVRLNLDPSEKLARNELTAIDDTRTVFRFRLRDLNWDGDDWKRIAAKYPYNVRRSESDEQSDIAMLETRIPMLRGDWFIYASSQPPLYEALIGFSGSLGELEASVGLNRIEELRSRQNVTRAGFGNSGVSRNNRLIERHVIDDGYYWISYDFGSNQDRKNFLENPFGPPGAFQQTALNKFEFRHDGGEIIYSLPNGFQGYLLIESDGKTIETGPPDIVYDSTMTGGVIINGISCMSCHKDGMRFNDSLGRVQEYARANRRRFPDKRIRTAIKDLYKGYDEVHRDLREDSLFFQRAMASAGIPDRLPKEPVRAVFDKFVQNLDMPTAAAELGLSTEDFNDVLERNDDTRARKIRFEAKSIQRDLFLDDFRQLFLDSNDELEYVPPREEHSTPYFKKRGDDLPPDEPGLLTDRSTRSEFARQQTLHASSMRKTPRMTDAGFGLEYILIPPGKIGSDSVEKPFYLARTELPRRVFEMVRMKDPSIGTFTPKSYPVCSITADEADSCVRKMSQFNADGNYRLPTTSELNYVHAILRHFERTEGAPRPSYGSELTDELTQDSLDVLGFYHLHGNLSEWTSGGKTVGLCYAGMTSEPGRGSRSRYVGMRVVFEP